MEYISELLARGTLGSKIALAMYALVAVFALVCAWRGFARGASRQTIRLLSIAAAAVLAFVAAKAMYPAIADFCDGKTVEELFSSVGAAQIYLKLGDEVQALLGALDAEGMAQLLLMLVSMVLTPLMFAVLFIVFSAFLELVHACVSGMLGFIHRNNNFGTRIVGLCLGALQGVLAGAILLVPVVGFLNFATEAVGRVEDPEHNVHALYNDYLADAAGSPLAEMISTYGGDALFAALTQVVSDEEEETVVDTREYANTVFDVYVGVDTLLDADFKALTEEEKAAFSDVVVTVGEDEYLAAIVAGILNTVGNDPELFYEIMENPDDPLSHIFAECLSIFATSDKSNLKGDLITIRDAYFLLSDSGALHAMSDGSDTLATALAATDAEGKTVAKRVISVLEANPRTRPLINAIARVTVSTLLGNASLDLGENTDAIYDAVKSGIAEDVLTIVKDDGDPDAYVAAVSEALGATFSASGITVTDESLDTMAEYISDNYANLETVTDDAVNDIIISYYAAHIVAE